VYSTKTSETKTMAAKKKDVTAFLVHSIDLGTSDRRDNEFLE